MSRSGGSRWPTHNLSPDALVRKVLTDDHTDLVREALVAVVMELRQRRVDPQGRARRRAARNRRDEQVRRLAPVRGPRRAGERVSRAPAGGPLPVPVARRQGREGARPDGRCAARRWWSPTPSTRPDIASRRPLDVASFTPTGRSCTTSRDATGHLRTVASLCSLTAPRSRLRHSGRSAPRIPERLRGGDWALEDSNPRLEVKSRRERSRTGLRSLAIRRQRAGSQARRAGLVGRQPARVGPLERRTV